MISLTEKNNHLIIKIEESRMDMTKSRKFHDLLNTQLEANPKNVVLEMGNLVYLDSSAMGVLVAVKKKIERYQGKLVLCNLSRPLLTLLKLSRLDNMFEFSDDLEKCTR